MPLRHCRPGTTSRLGPWEQRRGRNGWFSALPVHLWHYVWSSSGATVEVVIDALRRSPCTTLSSRLAFLCLALSCGLSQLASSKGAEQTAMAKTCGGGRVRIIRDGYYSSRKSIMHWFADCRLVPPKSTELLKHANNINSLGL